jgi:hypothetical protein
MASSGMLRRAALVRTDVSEELSVSIIRATRIGEQETLAATSNRRRLRKNTRHNIPEDSILHSHRRGNLKSYKVREESISLVAVIRHRLIKRRKIIRAAVY